MSASRLNRRQFLKLAGTTGALAVPAVFGLSMFRMGKGESPRAGSPFVADDDLGQWVTAKAATAPILVLMNERSDNTWGAYLAEILRAEGLNCFQIARWPAVTGAGASLKQFGLVLLAEGALDASQAESLTRYVAGGGRLVAMRPDARLAPLFGLERASGNTAEGYLRLDSYGMGRGLTAEPVQWHGVADHYRLAGAQAVAWLTDQTGARSAFPAVTHYHSGQGQAALWAFDLARSVVLTRQGNPQWANQERDEREGIRAHDAFVGWIDLERIATPQADEQMRLLSQMIGEMLSGRLPLPRLWYFPGEAQTMLIATGDSHQNPAAVVEAVLARVEQRGGHMSVYYTPPSGGSWQRSARRAKWWAADLPGVGERLTGPSAPPTQATVARWRARGHEFALHPYVDEGLEAGWRRSWQEFTGLGYGPVSPSTRTHRIAWTGWTETARIQAAYGIRMNLDYYHYGPAFRTKAGEWVYGYLTGSGLPMKFMDEQGRVLDIYQQLTHLVDEHLMKMPWGLGGPDLEAQAAVEVSQSVLRRSLDGAFGAITAQFHLDPFALEPELATRSARWLEGTLDYAREQGIPICSAAEWLQFTQARHDARMSPVEWSPAERRLDFQLAIQAVPNVELAVMLPLQSGDAKLAQVQVDGLTMRHRERQVGAVRYGWVPIRAGTHRVTALFG